MSQTDQPDDPKRPKQPPGGIDALGDLLDELVATGAAEVFVVHESELDKSKRETHEAFEERMSIVALEDHLFMVEYARACGWDAERLIQEVYPNMPKKVGRRLLKGTVTIDGYGRLHDVH